MTTTKTSNDDDGSGNDTQYEIQELIDSEVALTHWTGPDGTRLEETSLPVDGTEVCASTPTGDLEPYSSEYEGYMGNWSKPWTAGTTGRRSSCGPASRPSPTVRKPPRPGPSMSSRRWCEQDDASGRAGDRGDACAVLGTGHCAPAQRRRGAGSPGCSARRCGRRTPWRDAETAAMLLRPFRIENLTGAHVDSFGKIADGYGQPWTAQLLRTGSAGTSKHGPTAGGRNGRSGSADRLPGLCAGLRATGSAGAPAARQILDLAWEWLRNDIATGLASSSPSYRSEKLGGLGKPLASVLTAAAAIGAAWTRDAVSGHIRETSGRSDRAGDVRAARRSGAAPGRSTGQRRLRRPGRRLRGAARRPARPPAARVRRLVDRTARGRLHRHPTPTPCGCS